MVSAGPIRLRPPDPLDARVHVTPTLSSVASSAPLITAKTR